MQLIKNIDFGNRYSPKINFKSKENRNYDILNQKIINNEIFEMREKAKQTSRTYNSLGILSMAPLALLCQGDNYKKIEWKYMIFPAMFLAFINTITRLGSYSSEYKENTIKSTLKKEKLSTDILFLSVLPTMEIMRHTLNGTMKTKEGKIRGAVGIGLSFLTGFALNFLKNKNIENCENEINNLRKTAKAA